MNKSLLAVAVASLLSPISNLHAQEASTDETMVVLRLVPILSIIQLTIYLPM